MSSIAAGTTTGSALVSTGDTTGQLVLKTNGTTTALTIDTSQNVTIAGNLTVTGTFNQTGAFTFLSTVDISNAATVDFTLPSGYDAYYFVLGNVIPDTDGVALRLRTSTDGGSTFDSGASDYAGLVASAATPSASLFDHIRVSPATSMGNAAGEEGTSGSVLVYFPHLAKYTQIILYTAGFNSSTAFAMVCGGGARVSSADVDAIRFYMGTGNISSGSITLYGMKNA